MTAPLTKSEILSEMLRVRQERRELPCDGSGRFPEADEWAEELDAEEYELGLQLAEIEDAEAEAAEMERAA